MDRQVCATIRLMDDNIMLSGQLNFHTAPIIYQESLPLIMQCETLTFDFAQVQGSDSSGLALIIEWIKYGRNNHKPVQFKHISSELMSLARVSSLEELVSES